MIDLRIDADRLVLQCQADELRPRHFSQLHFWGFTETGDGPLLSTDADINTVLPKVIAYIERERLNYAVDDNLRELLAADNQSRELLHRACVLLL